MVRMVSSNSDSIKRLRRDNLAAMLLCTGLIALEVYLLGGPGTLMIIPTMSAVYVFSQYHLQYRDLIAIFLIALFTFLATFSYLALDETGLNGANLNHAFEIGLVAATIALALAMAGAMVLSGKRQGIGIAIGVVLVTMLILATIKPE